MCAGTVPGVVAGAVPALCCAFFVFARGAALIELGVAPRACVICVMVVYFIGEIFMRPVKRYKVHKGKSARKFRRNVRKTKAVNVGVARGGIRL